MTDPYHWLTESLTTLRQAHWYRSPQPLESPSGPEIRLEGRRLVNFASNDYLGLTQDPRLKAAAQRALEIWGTGSSGSPLLSGYGPLQAELEEKLARWKGAEAALVFSSGYLANVGTVLALVGPRDLILADEYNHSSLKRGAQLSGAKVCAYPHLDMAALSDLLEKYRAQARRCLILSDGVFSMDGDICPLPELLDLAEHYRAMALVDDAHATGVLGPAGAGSRDYFQGQGFTVPQFLQMGTLSKALGSLGGYVAGRREWIEFLRNRAATWVYSTALAPANLAAALAAVEIIQTEPEHLGKLWDNVRFLREKLTALPLARLPSQSPILGIGLPNAQSALAMSQNLRELGFFAPAIRPPTVPTSRLRLSLMTRHQPSHLQGLVNALKALSA
ncbi:MAG: 8-amino-7-oxononanoate synthase [Cyanobacteria bacterium RI_101]|nr:8-amino-7-oxononanoate synthase [Cyanobacteria bacterium RI_101]